MKSLIAFILLIVVVSSFASTDVNKFIEDEIKNNEIVIFSKSYCPYCKNTKQMLTKAGYTFKAIELDQHPNGKAIQNALFDLTSQKTVPNVFIKGKHVGGSDVVKFLIEKNQIQMYFKDEL